MHRQQIASCLFTQLELTDVCEHTSYDIPHVISHLELKVCKLHDVPEKVPCLWMNGRWDEHLQNYVHNLENALN